MTAPEARKVKTLRFRAEANRLLHLVVHSVYSDRDVFLRELVSNASDALDKLRLDAMVNKDVADAADDIGDDPHIDVELDPSARALVVRDNGIGMSYKEVVDLIGTLAKSGTRELRAQLAHDDERQGTDLIGQFGIGFYSCFMVAESVTLETRKRGESTGTRWFSDGQESYTIEEVDDLPRGTTVTLRLSAADPDDGLRDYADHDTLREIVSHYSEFVAWPVRLTVREDGTSAPTAETINAMRPIWSKPSNDVSDDEYNAFYRHVTGDWNDPLDTVHVSAEGALTYHALLYLPARAPYDLYQRDGSGGIRLYINKVLVLANTEVLLPPYLRFVRGVVDARDLSLNVSRELLQHDRHIQVMQRRLTRSVLRSISQMQSDDPRRYAQFWSQYGRALKEGLLADGEQADTVLELCRFASDRTGDPLGSGGTTLPEYLSRRQQGQEAIYYAIGESRTVLEASPHLEVFRARGIEVLLLTDPVDELWTRIIKSFADLPLESVAQAGVTLPAVPAAAEDAEQERRLGEEGAGDGDSAGDADSAGGEDLVGQTHARVASWLAEILFDVVSDVRVSARLTSSAACLITDPNDLTPSQEKIYRVNGHAIPRTRRVLEINPDHPLITRLRRDVDDGRGEDPDADLSPELTRIAQLLFGMALLAEGGEFDDPARFVRTLADQLTAEDVDAASD